MLSRLALLEFTLPLAVLLPVRFFLGERGSLSLEIFLAGTGLEVVLLFALQQARARSLVAGRRAAFYDFLVRLLVGLPFTAYLIVSAPYSVIGLLRFFPAFYYFLDPARFRFSLQFLFFFALGSLCFAFFKDFPYPGRVQTVTIAAGLLVAALWYAATLRNRLVRREALIALRDRGRLERRLALVAAREKAALEATMPATFARLFREQRKLHPESGRYLVALLRFPDLHASLEDFADAVDAPSRAKGLDAFAGEWDRFISGLLEQAIRKQYLIARRGETLLCARSRPETPERLAEETFRLLFWIQEILRNNDQLRRRLHARGRRGWQVLAGLGLGEATGLPQGGGSPAWMMLGGVVRELGAFLASAPTAGPASDALWLQPQLKDLVYDFYEAGSGAFFREWYAPGYLKPDFARDESGIEPGDDFFDRLRYGH